MERCRFPHATAAEHLAIAYSTIRRRNSSKIIRANIPTDSEQKLESMQIEPNKTAILLVLIICSTTVPAVARNSEGFFSRVVAGLHEADVIKTKLLNDIQDVKQDIVMNSKSTTCR